MKRGAPFSARVVAGWLALTAVVAALSLYGVTRNGTPAALAEHGLESTAFSKSAVGHYVFFRLLQELGLPVDVTTAPGNAGSSLVILAEPNSDAQTFAHVERVLEGRNNVLLILPKRSGSLDPQGSDRIVSDRLLSVDAASKFLTVLGSDAEVERYDRAGIWHSRVRGWPNPHIDEPQLLRENDVTALSATSRGILVGVVRKDGARVVIASDPDLFENFAIGRGDNAGLAVAIVRAARGDATRILIDESIHGLAPKPYSAARLLLTFPFVLVTLQLAVAAALLIWSGSGRFGSPVAVAPPIAHGLRSLIRSGARLLAMGTPADILLDRYAESLLRDTAGRMRAPNGLGSSALIDWLKKKGCAPNAASAEALFDWRNDVLDRPSHGA